ncbi:MAG TPA: MATE family efflux transporter [Anaeromyxobacteraceae bacterium]|nr:MATE family efflux transporter [Anaeromyxobacteraceae bacterium]
MDRTELAKELRALWRLALPLAVASAGQSLMAVVGSAVAGRAGAAALGGVGLGNTVFMVGSVFGMGLVMGLDALVAQAIGAGDPARARRLARKGTAFALAAGLVLAGALALAPLAFGLTGIDPAVAPEATRYLRWRALGMPAVLAFFAVRAWLQALGRTRPLVTSTVAANLANLALAVPLALGGGALPAWCGPLRALPAFGAAGAGAAATLASALQAGLMLLALRDRDGRLDAAPRRGELRAALRIGVPIAFHFTVEMGLFTLVGFLAGRLGELPMAAHQVALTLVTVSFTVVVGVGSAGSVRVGHAIGAGDAPAVRRAGFATFASGAAVMACSALCIFLFPRALSRLVTSDAAVVAAAAPLLAVAAVFQVFDGVQAVGAGLLRGAGDTRFTFLANVAGHYLVGLPVTVGLGVLAARGVVGLWWGLCAGLVTVAVAMLLRFRALSARPIAPLH